MKINTITFHRTTNYGASLQAYALQYYLKKIGAESEVIDYVLLKPRIFRSIQFISIKTVLRDLYLNLFSLIKLEKIKEKYNKFEKFTNNYIKLTRKYNTIYELKKDPPKSDCYITGSDQLWNMTYRISPEFFLDFGDESIKKYSYAISIGIYDYPDEKLNYMQNHLKYFQNISVREEEAKKFLKNKFQIDSQVDVDPTLLLGKDEWLEISKTPEIKEPYILCYPLLSNEDMQKVLDKLKK